MIVKTLSWHRWRRERQRSRNAIAVTLITVLSVILIVDFDHFLKIFLSVIFVELVIILSLTYSRSFYGVSDVHAPFLIVNWIIAANVTFFVSSFLQAVFEYFIYISYIVGQGVIKGTGKSMGEDATGIGRDEYEGEYEYE